MNKQNIILKMKKQNIILKMKKQNIILKKMKQNITLKKMNQIIILKIIKQKSENLNYLIGETREPNKIVKKLDDKINKKSK